MERLLTKEEISAYERDGVICVRNILTPEWIDKMTSVVDAQLAAPSRWVNDANPNANRNRLFTDRYLWRENPEIRNFVFESGIAAIAGQAMRSSVARFYFDHMLVKEPDTTAPTPWHQDVPYWPFKGRQICSIWVALTDSTVEQSALEFVRGSHADRRYYMPEQFGKRDNHPSSWQLKGIEGEPVPAIEEDRSAYDIVGWDMKAGDCVLFSAWVLHGARGNSSSKHRRAAISTRWLGDDAIWYPHPGSDPTVTQADVTVQPGEAAHDDDRFPIVWKK
ncbi:phytanoyl-CoA dioxygenase family protein [Comamonas badia]|uniref:phytanoyl-CoA dioxygenase family protein n=1 Tax=Comamonas badia TaxID=265291 RepID=UPI000467D84F|nr:phytanoyl-CoA dioxygenase family protein [Comamonas badia]